MPEVQYSVWNRPSRVEFSNNSSSELWCRADVCPLLRLTWLTREGNLARDVGQAVLSYFRLSQGLSTDRMSRTLCASAQPGIPPVLSSEKSSCEKR
ncbi:hypothetical protein AVEN_17088-1 [Araneus ventricosus]|uniref:Ig-like domain-containing protein n=1 Tax=Araneus ventricosus TaxID=182803 RepID=A0A4Y2PGY4_ARAVE|nr:hypothetical protein AVEN_17088-1 [Araneus ventricosus]